MLHNTAIAEYVAGGCREPRKLLSTLEALKQRLEDARAEEFGEGDNLGGDTDPSLTVYNMAVLLFQLKQFARCRTLLEDMFSNIEPIDEFLAFKLCFLLLDVYLLQRQAERAAEVLAYLEKSFANLTKGEGGKENGEAAVDIGDGEAKRASPSGDWPNKRSARRPPTDITPDEVRAALSVYKAKLALTSRASKSSKREIKTTLNACAPNTTGLFLKCNLEWQRQNYRKAIKLLNNSCQTTEADVNVPALYFNNLGCIHHCMRKHAAAAFFFARALQENDGLYKSADDKAACGEGVSLRTFSCDRRCEISYNRGLQQLLSGRPEEAFASFMVGVDLMHAQPRVWLRLGEACVATLVKRQIEAERGAGTPSVSPLVAAIAHGSRQNGAAAGGSSSRYLVLPTDGPVAAGRDGMGPPAEDADAPSGALIGAPSPPAPTLSFGIKALRNAVLQCNTQLGAAQLSAMSSSDYTNLLASAANGTLSSTDEQAMQLHTVQRLSLLLLSWSALTMEDYVPALSWASQLLGLEACPAALKAYAYLYSCDALCHLNRVDEALAQLTAALELGEPLSPVASSTGAELATAAADGEGMDTVRNPYSPIPTTAAGGGGGEAGRGALYTNLAVVHILAGDRKSAESYAQQAFGAQPENRQTQLCCVYLELAGGRTEAALELLKKQRMPTKQ